MPATFTSKLPDYEYLNNLFTFKDNNLFWNYIPESYFTTENKWELFNHKHLNKIAGKYGERGYGHVIFNGLSYSITKVSYIIQSKNNIDENTIIDHIDGNPRNNHITNLRIATLSQNSMNAKKRENKTISIKGIDWNKSSNRFRARVCVNGVRHTKYYDNLLDAVASIFRMRNKYNGEFSTNR